MGRVQRAWHRFTAALKRFGSVLATFTEELGVALGLVLIAIGFWDVWRPASFLTPGIVLLWLFTPQRKGFIEQQMTVMQPRRRKDSN